MLFSTPYNILTRTTMSYLTILVVAFLGIWIAVVESQTTNSTSADISSGLDFGPVNFGGYDNYVYRDNITAVQVVISE
jgi:hypothetical protein